MNAALPQTLALFDGMFAAQPSLETYEVLLQVKIQTQMHFLNTLLYDPRRVFVCHGADGRITGTIPAKIALVMIVWGNWQVE